MPMGVVPRSPGVCRLQRSGAADTQRVSDDQVRRARLAVANGALGVDDCVQLLEMLGLNLDEDGQAPVQR